MSDQREHNLLPEVWPNRLREIREAEGDTIVSFCKKTGLNDSRVSRTEQGKNSTNLDTIAIYAQQYKRPLSDFIADNYRFCDFESHKELSRSESKLVDNFRRLAPDAQEQVANFVNLLAMLAPASAAMATLLSASPEQRQLYLDILDKTAAMIDASKK